MEKENKITFKENMWIFLFVAIMFFAVIGFFTSVKVVIIDFKNIIYMAQKEAIGWECLEDKDVCFKK